MVEAKGLVGGFDRFVASLDELVDLFFGVAASFGEKDFGTFDGWGLDFLVAVVTVGIRNFAFEIAKNGLFCWQEFLGARDFGSVDSFHKIIIAWIDTIWI